MAKKQWQEVVEAVTYDTRVLNFPDGTKRIVKSSRTYHRAGDEEKAAFQLYKENWLLQNGFSIDDEWVFDCYFAPNFDGSTVARKETDNMKRAIQEVYNIAKSNEFQYFVVFTFNPAVVDSYDYDSCVKALSQWMNNARQRGIKWLIVPEQHKKGRYHFHALVAGKLKCRPAINEKTGLPMFDKSGRQIYHVGDYSWGYTTVTEIDDPVRTASYISKYLVKDITVPKGRKRYWASYGLERPTEELTTMNDWEFAQQVAQGRYFKEIENQWGKFWLTEVDSNNP